MQTVVVTCHTTGCENEDIPIEMPATYVMDGEESPITAFACGPCGQPIEDVEQPRA